MSKSDSTPSHPATAQWAIDPALQQISSATAATHTPNQAYYGYPSYYYQQPQQAQATRSSTPAVASTSTAVPKSTGGGALDSSDINTLSDAIGSAGIDLRAEEESLQKSHDSSLSYRQFHSDRTHTQPQNLSFNSHFLGTTVRAIAADTHKLGKPISDDTINYLALALRTRLQDLIKGMIAASHHRTDTAYDHATSLYEGTDIPMWDVTVRRDIAKQLAVLERIEKEDELKTRRDRKERADMAAAQLAALQSGTGSSSSYDMDNNNIGEDIGENPKKKRKKDGPGVTAKNMSEDVRKQMSNLVANQAIGGKKYSWMTASNSAAPRAAKASEKTTEKSASSPATTSAPRSTWSKPYVSATAKEAGKEAGSPTEEDTRTRVTMRDAMFVVEKERGHGGGRGAALGWT